MAVAGQNTRRPLARPENYCESKQTYFSYSLDKAFHSPEFQAKLFFTRNWVGGFSYNVVSTPCSLVYTVVQVRDGALLCSYIGMVRTVLLHCPVSPEIRTVDSQSDYLLFISQLVMIIKLITNIIVLLYHAMDFEWNSQQLSMVKNNLSLKFIRLLRVVLSSEQCLNRPAVNAVQGPHHYPKTR